MAMAMAAAGDFPDQLGVQKAVFYYKNLVKVATSSKCGWRRRAARTEIRKIKMAAREGTFKEAKKKLEKLVEQLTWRWQVEKRLRIHLQEAKSQEISELQDASPSMQIQVEEAPPDIKEKDSPVLIQDIEKFESLMAVIEGFKAMLLSERQAAEEGRKACKDAEGRIIAELTKKIEDAVQKVDQLQDSVQRLEEKHSNTESENEKKESGDQALHQQIQENQDLLIKCIMQNVGFSRGKPVAACVIYKCLLHWRSFEDEKTSLFDRIIQTIDSAIEVPDNNDVLAYWLSSSCTLLFLLKNTPSASWRMTQVQKYRQSAGFSFWDNRMFGRDRFDDDLQQLEANCPAFLFKKQLSACLEKIYRMIRDNIKKEISSLLELCIQAPKASLASLMTDHSQAYPIANWRNIMKSLDSYLETMKANCVHHFFVSKMLDQIFSFINISLFNSLLLRRECCSFSNGEYVEAGLAELKKWCSNSRVYPCGGAWDKLKDIKQGVNFLVLRQKSQRTLNQLTRQFCFVLSTKQLYRISTLYWDDRCCTGTVSPDVVSNMRVQLSRSTISFSPVENNFLLNDDLSISFTVDDIYNISQHIELADVDPPPLLRGKSGFMFLLQQHSHNSPLIDQHNSHGPIIMPSHNSASLSTSPFSSQPFQPSPFGFGVRTTAQACSRSGFGQTDPIGSCLGNFGPGSPPTSAAPTTIPFSSLFGDTVNATSSQFTLTYPTSELSRSSCITFQSPKPSQSSQPMNNWGAYSGTTAQAPTGCGSGQIAQVGPGQQALGSLFGSFGQSRQPGSGVTGTCFASSSGFAGTQPTRVFADAATNGGFAGFASTGSGFAALASGGGDSASVALTGGELTGETYSGGGFPTTGSIA